MGFFVSPIEMKSKALSPLIQQMETPALDSLFIEPAERMIEEAFQLNLTTDGYPEHLSALFQTTGYERLRNQYQKDMKQAIILLVNRMAINPHGYGSQSLSGGSVSYGRKIPPEVKALMRRWGRPRRLFRV